MKRIILTLTAAMLTTGLLYGASSLASPPPVVQLRTVDADTAELDRLIDVFEGQADEHPSPYLSARLGELYLTRAQTNGDLEDYSRALGELDPLDDHTDPTIAVPLARTQIALHDFRGALGTISPLPASAGSTTLDSLSFDAHLGLGQFDRASESLDRLLDRHPTEPAIMIRQAELAFLTGDLDVAIRTASHALEIAEDAGLGASDMVFYLTATARYLVTGGEYGDAMTLTSAARELDPNDPAAALIASRAAAGMGDISEAIDLAGIAANLSPNPATLAFLADLHLAAGDGDAAVVELETIDAIASLDQTALRRGVALARAEHGRFLEDALVAAERELDERSDPYAHHLMATVLNALGSNELAEDHFGDASTVADPMIWYRGGLIAAANGDDAAAVERLRRSLDLSPEFHPLYADEARAIIEALDS